MNVKIEDSWKQALKKEFKSDYFSELATFVKREYTDRTVYPPPKDIFRAFNICPVDKVKVIIIGQDPYHGANQANGLCFSVAEGTSHPPSLQNIFKEIKDDLGKPPPESGSLDHWGRQGVLLLNATLTVVGGQAGAHQGKGWERFTDAAIKYLSDNKKNLVFLLWGNYAQEKGAQIDRQKHFVLQSPHPSPFSADRGFFGCRHFSKANTYLLMHGMSPVDW